MSLKSKKISLKKSLREIILFAIVINRWLKKEMEELIFMDTTMNANNVRLQPRVQVHHPKLAMVSIMLGAFVGMFSETSLNIALPQLMAEHHVSQDSIQWLVTGYMLVIGIILPLSSLLTSFQIKDSNR